MGKYYKELVENIYSQLRPKLTYNLWYNRTIHRHWGLLPNFE